MGTFKSKFASNVLDAMKIVPRHIFFGDLKKNEISMSKIYSFDNHSSMDGSAETIALQLSLAKIKSGSKVLLAGANSGYITSLVAQIVGKKGLVITVSSNKELLKKCEEETVKSPFEGCMKFRQVTNVHQKSFIGDQIKEDGFRSIIYCGASNFMLKELRDLVRNNIHGGRIVIPVENDVQQYLQTFYVPGQWNFLAEEYIENCDINIILKKAQ